MAIAPLDFSYPNSILKNKRGSNAKYGLKVVLD